MTLSNWGHLLLWQSKVRGISKVHLDISLRKTSIEPLELLGIKYYLLSFGRNWSWKVHFPLSLILKIWITFLKKNELAFSWFTQFKNKSSFISWNLPNIVRFLCGYYLFYIKYYGGKENYPILISSKLCYRCVYT